MDWNNNRVLEFIALLKEEPCIWNPKHKNHKNRGYINDAWTKIQSKFSMRCTFEELKKKRNILLTQYRECLKKIKESGNTCFDAEEDYRPSWFAFDAIHDYMRTIHDTQAKTQANTQVNIQANTQEKKSVGTSSERPLVRKSNIKRPASLASSSISGHPVHDSKRQCLLIGKKQEDDSIPLIKNRCNRTDNEKDVTECNLYGQLLAQKLKTLDVSDRLVLMNEIDNIVFKYVMKVKKRDSLVRAKRTESSKNQTQIIPNGQLSKSPWPSATIQSPDASQENMQNSRST